jgi:hypothetical protein
VGYANHHGCLNGNDAHAFYQESVGEV